MNLLTEITRSENYSIVTCLDCGLRRSIKYQQNRAGLFVNVKILIKVLHPS